MQEVIIRAGRSLLLGSMLAISACAHGDHSLTGENAALLEKTLTVGTTTEADARRLFGKPRSVEVANGEDGWRYDLTKVDMSPASIMPVIQLFYMQDSTNDRNLQLTFDRNHRLLRWSYLEANQSHYRGL